MVNRPSSGLIHESDRGCVLLGAAILEQRLAELFCFTFKTNDISRKIADSIFDSNGPLSTFSSKIKLAYALGYIDRLAYEDLEKIRKIRNEFAHTAKAVDFLQNDIAKDIERLHCVKDFKNAMPRYSPPTNFSMDDEFSESFLRTEGYIKYTKAIFSLGIQKLETDLMMSLITLAGASDSAIASETE